MAFQVDFSEKISIAIHVYLLGKISIAIDVNFLMKK